MSQNNETTVEVPLHQLDSYLNNYEKIRTVGKGAFGTAVLYRRVSDSKFVVLKEINMTDLNATERQMALNEVQVLSLLQHPCIISYLGSFEHDATLIIEMEYADGGTLSQFISRSTKPIPEPEILSIFQQVVEAIHYMHENNVLHRDLKTANVFLTKDFGVKVGDFGISKVMTTKAQAHTVLGTPYYISPEICEGKQYNEKSDMWALGCILYEMACREKTFQAPNLPALVNKIMKGSYKPLPKVYSSGLNSLVASLLSKDPELRPLSGEVLEKLVSISQQLKENFTGTASTYYSNINRERSVLYQISGQGPTFSMRSIPLPPQSKILKVAVSNTHFIALTSELFVFTWGEGKRGQLGYDPAPIWVEEPMMLQSLATKSITMIGAGDGFSVFVSDSGMVLTCGDSTFGCLGHGDSSAVYEPKLVEKLLAVDVVDMSCGDNHTGILSGDGMVYCWGKLHHKVVFTPSIMDLPKNETAQTVTCGPDAISVITEDGKLLVAGINSCNKLGLNVNFFKYKETVDIAEELTVVKSLKKWHVRKVTIGLTHSIIITDEGTVITMGSNSENQLGHNKLGPSRVKHMECHETTMAACGPSYSVVGIRENALFFWGTRFKKGFMHAPDDSLMSTGILETEVATKPQEILALYSSPSQISRGLFVTINSIWALVHCIVLLVDTTAPLPKPEEKKPEPVKVPLEIDPQELDSQQPIPDWIKAELALSEDVWPGEFNNTNNSK